MTEAQIQRETVGFLRSIGCWVWQTSQGYRKDPGGTRMTAGLPDLYVVHEKAYTWAEMKTPKGKLSPAQAGFRDVCEMCGVPWHLWRDVRDAWDWAVSVGLIEEA